MSNRDPPHEIILDEVLSLSLASTIKNHLLKPDWTSFFNSLFTIGLIFMLCSLFGLFFLSLVTKIVVTTTGASGLITTVLQSISPFLIVAYVFILLLVRAVERCNSGRLIIDEHEIDLQRELIEKFNSRVPVLVLDVLGIVLSGLLLAVTYTFRATLIIGEVPVSPDFSNPPVLLSLSIIFMLDLGYMGLVIATFGQLYDAVVTVNSRGYFVRD